LLVSGYTSSLCSRQTSHPTSHPVLLVMQVYCQYFCFMFMPVCLGGAEPHTSAWRVNVCMVTGGQSDNLRVCVRGGVGWGATARHTPCVCMQGDVGGRGRLLLHTHPAFACEGVSGQGLQLDCRMHLLHVREREGCWGGVARRCCTLTRLQARFRVQGRGGQGTAATHGWGHVQGQLACTKATD
jgi:hypothetical protein